MTKKAHITKFAQMTPERFTDNLKYWEYLFELQESAVCNMFESPIYLKRRFGVSESEGIRLMTEWMNDYKDIRNKYDALVAKELDELTQEESHTQANLN